MMVYISFRKCQNVIVLLRNVDQNFRNVKIQCLNKRKFVYSRDGCTSKWTSISSSSRLNFRQQAYNSMTVGGQDVLTCVTSSCRPTTTTRHCPSSPTTRSRASNGRRVRWRGCSTTSSRCPPTTPPPCLSTKRYVFIFIIFITLLIFCI